MGGSRPRSWRVLRDPPAPGAYNMAVDEALARCMSEGVGALRIYRWIRPTVSFGRNQPARGRYSPTEARRLGVDLVRRPTGGRAVWHEEELTYAAVLPVTSFGGLRPAYRELHRGLVAGLRSLGVPVATAGQEAGMGGPGLAGDGTCFRTPAPGEVVAGAGKLVGSAQVRIRKAILQHGSILLAGDQGRLRLLAEGRGAGAARRGDPEAARRGHFGGAVPSGEIGAPAGSDYAVGGDPEPVATLSHFLDPLPSVQELEEALVEGLASTLGGSWEPDGLSAKEGEVADELANRYQSPEWTWRR